MYYYQHANGTVQQKPDIVVDMGGGPMKYFDSPFCKKWWYSETPVVGWHKDEVNAPSS